MTVRTTRQAVEVLGLEPSDLDKRLVTRQAVEVLGLEPSDLDKRLVTRQAVEVLGLEPTLPGPTPDSILVTRQAVEVLSLEPSDLDRRFVTRQAIEVLALQGDTQPPVTSRVTREAIEVLSLEPSSLDSALVTRQAIEVLALEPFIPEVVEAESFFWDKKNGGWYTDTVDITRRPTSSAVFDGDDPDDRLVAFGTIDGAVRIIDVQADDDDGSKIQSEILLGPFSAGLPDAEARWSQLQTHLASDQAQVAYDWFVSETVDVDIDTLTPVATGVLPVGLSDVLYQRARGLYVWIRLRGLGPAWSWEAGSVTAAIGGRARTRKQ